MLHLYTVLYGESNYLAKPNNTLLSYPHEEWLDNGVYFAVGGAGHQLPQAHLSQDVWLLLTLHTLVVVILCRVGHLGRNLRRKN